MADITISIPTLATDIGAGIEHAPHPRRTKPVGVDTTLALVVNCDSKRASHLTKLEADGRGTTDGARIGVVGTKPSEVAKPFASRQTEICPGN